jgi:hypothetical protein
MRANELRIGNLVKHIDKDSVFTVKGIDLLGIDCENDIESMYSSYEMLYYVKLTEEWLLKFGFYLDKNQWYNIKYFTDCNESTEEMCITINLASNRCAIFDAIEETDMVNILSYPIFTAKRIDYVHQLQNLYFALTGKELTYGGNK